MITVILVSSLTAFVISFILLIAIWYSFDKFLEEFFDKANEFVKQEIKTAYQKELLKGKEND